MELTSNERQLIYDIFALFQQSDVDFVLLRNYRGLPDTIGNDLDLFVPEKASSRAIALLKESMAKHGFQCVKFLDLGYVQSFWLSVDCVRTLHIDLYPGAFTWKGLKYLSDDEVLQKKGVWSGLPILHPFHEALSLLTTSVLWGGFYKQKYVGMLEFLLPEAADRDSFAAFFEDKFRIKLPVWVWSPQGPDASSLAEFVGLLRAAVFKKCLRETPGRTGLGLLAYGGSFLRRCIFSPGLCIAVIGPDGAGKSTLIQALDKSLAPLFSGTVYRHWRPSLLKDVGILLKQRSGSHEGEIVSNPHAKNAHGVMVSSLRLLYYLTDFVLGMLLLQWRQKSKNRLILFDRFSVDMWLDARRFRLGLPTRVVRFCAAMVPPPDFYILLGGDPDKIYERKPETSRQEVAQFMSGYAWILDHQADKACLLDAANPPEEVASQAHRAILEHLAKQCRR